MVNPHPVGTRLSLMHSLRNVQRIRPDNRELIKSVTDALAFLSLLPSEGNSGFITINDDSPEIILRWYNGCRWVNVHFEGDGTYQYTYTQDVTFVAGQHQGDINATAIPPDLLEYLEAIFQKKGD